MPNTSAENTIHIEAPPTHCTACGAEYRNIQHPLKPLGVTMMRVCDCKPVYTTVGSTTFVTMVPPTKDGT